MSAAFALATLLVVQPVATSSRALSEYEASIYRLGIEAVGQRDVALAERDRCYESLALRAASAPLVDDRSEPLPWGPVVVSGALGVLVGALAVSVAVGLSR